MPLLPAPFSSKSLVDADDPYFRLQPYQGGWIVTNRGEHVGSVKRSKGGWKLDPSWAVGDQLKALQRATRLLDETQENPLTPKGRKILAAMKREYGAKKGTQVFYASRNSGRITGVDENPVTGSFVHEHPWMTLLIALVGISTVGAVLGANRQ